MAKSVLLYGESGTYKTSQLGELIEYQCERLGEGTHCKVVTSDSGWGPLKRQVRRGKAKVWSLKASGLDNLLAVQHYAAMGYWPNELDEETGIADYKKGLSLDLSATAGVFWEGLTQNADLMMQHLTEKKVPIGGEGLQGTFQQEVRGLPAVQFASATRSTYGFIQAKTREYVKLLTGLPVDRVVVTAHEGKGDDIAKKMFFGPAIAGKAGADKIPAWFGCTFHHESYMFDVKRRDAKGKEMTVSEPGVRAFFQRHPDPEVPMVFWPAKLDCVPRHTAAIRRAYPQGFVPLLLDEDGVCVSGIRSVLEIVDEEEGEDE